MFLQDIVYSDQYIRPEMKDNHYLSTNTLFLFILPQKYHLLHLYSISIRIRIRKYKFAYICIRICTFPELIFREAISPISSIIRGLGIFAPLFIDVIPLYYRNIQVRIHCNCLIFLVLVGTLILL